MKVLHVDGEILHQKFLYFLFVLLILGWPHIKSHELNSSIVSGLFQCLNVTIEHSEKFDRIEFLTIELDFHMQGVATHGYNITSLNPLTEMGEYRSQR